MACIRIPSPVIPKLLGWSVHLTYARMHIKNAHLSTPLADLEYKKHFWLNIYYLLEFEALRFVSSSRFSKNQYLPDCAMIAERWEARNVGVPNSEL